MSRDFDNFPVYDPVVKTNRILSDDWQTFMSTFVETLQAYLSQNGIFVPRLSTTDRAKIQNPEIGQVIFNTTDNKLQVYKATPTPGWVDII